MDPSEISPAEADDPHSEKYERSGHQHTWRRDAHRWPIPRQRYEPAPDDGSEPDHHDDPQWMMGERLRGIAVRERDDAPRHSAPWAGQPQRDAEPARDRTTGDVEERIVDDPEEEGAGRENRGPDLSRAKPIPPFFQPAAHRRILASRAAGGKAAACRFRRLLLVVSASDRRRLRRVAPAASRARLFGTATVGHAASTLENTMNGKALTHRIGCLACATLATLGVACGGAAPTEDELAPPEPTRARNGNLDRSYETAADDFNFDGEPDQITYLVGGTPVWAERDLDFDGRVDVYEHYDSAGRLTEQEFQLDFDDAIDVVRFYVDGVLVRKELSTGFDSTPTLFKYYAPDGELLRVERDRDGDGIIDHVNYYEGGQLVRIGIDLTGDGIPDDIESYQ